MKVIVSGEVWANRGSDVPKLHKLMNHAWEDRHKLVSDPPEAVHDWLGTLDADTRDAYAYALKFSEKEESRLAANVATVRIRMTDTPLWEDPEAVLPLDDALKLLAEPLGILLENAKTDWNFLLGMMLSTERDRIADALEKRWVDPLNGGGTMLLSILQDRANNNVKRLRTFLMFDSDRLHPDEIDQAWTRANGAKCAAAAWENLAEDKIPGRYWRLRRRFIESYMPQPELRKAAKPNVHLDAVDAFFRLTRDQQWYFNMKEGFAGDRKRTDQDLYRRGHLYDSIRDNPDEAALETGFGTQTAKHYAKAVENEFDWDDDARAEAREAIPRLMRLL